MHSPGPEGPTSPLLKADMEDGTKSPSGAAENLGDDKLDLEAENAALALKDFHRSALSGWLVLGMYHSTG